MNCSDCNGACCRYIAVFCPQYERNFRELAKIRGARLMDDWAFYKIVCPKLDIKTSKCTIQDHKPPFCRLTAKGCKECRQLEGFKD
jgi:hypothetical protein